MGRRISVGIVGSGGSSGLGTIIASGSGNTLSTALANQDLIIDPNGTGGVSISADVTITDQQDLRLREAAANGTNYIGMQAASSMAANYTITWPAAVSATSGFVLSSDGSGNLSWASAGGNIAIADPGATATLHYPLFATNAGALPSTLSPNARDNLTFVPSTGELFSTLARHPNVIGSAASGGTLTIRGTSSGTKAAASVLLSDGVASTTTTSGTLVVTGGVGISGAIYAGSVQSTPIGNSTRSTGAFTTLAANDSVTITATTTARQLNPETTNTYDLGTTSLRWRTVYTNDLELSNGIGDYTIVEGEDDLFLYNNKKGKVYKFAIIEVDPSMATPKAQR
jgi:hypothetical protein